MSESNNVDSSAPTVTTNDDQLPYDDSESPIFVQQCILAELRVLAYILHQGMSIADDLDAMRKQCMEDVIDRSDN
jgi:rRNA-processing protein FCF1